MSETTDPDLTASSAALHSATEETLARALHAADRTLNWLRWEQLKEATRDEYRRNSIPPRETE